MTALAVTNRTVGCVAPLWRREEWAGCLDVSLLSRHCRQCIGATAGLKSTARGNVVPGMRIMVRRALVAPPYRTRWQTATAGRSL